MNKVLILTDSTCDLSKELIEKNNIHILPLYVNFKDKTFQDGVDITPTELFAMVEKNGELPKTSAISIGTFYVKFEEYLKEGYDIFYTGISSKMSVSYNNAVLASKEFEEGRIFVHDSLNLSTGIGLQVLKACKFRDEGKSAKEIYEAMQGIQNKIKTSFVIHTMEYLYKGGRCSSMQKIFGTFLKIKPIIRVTDGKMDVYKKPRGPMHKALEEMLLDIKADVNNLDLDHVMITHSFADEDVPFLLEELKKLNIPNIDVTRAGCVISSHCGKRTIGILYIVK